MPRVPVLSVPLNDAVMVALVLVDTMSVVIVNVALLVPAATVTVAGTWAAALSLVRATTIGATAEVLSVTVPVELAEPPITDAGDTETLFSRIGLAISETFLLEPL